MAKDTKERILALALDKFSQNGYDGTNIRELTSSLGLVKSALYRHFDSKEAIWNALLDKMEAYYAAHFGSTDRLPPTPASCEELFKLSMGMIRFTVNDQQIILTRKLLLTEQFHDDRVRRLAGKHFLEGTASIFTQLFEQMMAAGLLQKADPAMLAFAYTAPITALIHHCDRHLEPQEVTMERIARFARHFIDTHAAK